MDEKKFDNQYQWILRQKKAAVKRKESRIWYVIDRLEKQDVFKFGVALSLARQDANLDKDPSSSHRVVRFPIRLPACPQWLAWIFVGLCTIAIILGVVKNYSSILHLSNDVIMTWANLFLQLFAIVLGYTLSVIWQAMIVLSYCQERKYIFGISWYGMAVEPVVWRLGLPIMAPFFSLMFPLLYGGACWAWLSINPILLKGLAIGCWFYIIVALFPLRPGPGTRLIEWLFHIEDLSQRLRWAIASRFLPAGQIIKTGGGASMAWAGFLLALWISLAGVTFRFLLRRAAFGLSLPGFIWSSFISLAGLYFIFWLIMHMISLYHVAYFLRGRQHLVPITPSDSERKAFVDGFALLNSMPELRHLEWRWYLAPAGTFLIRYGGLERIFYWLSYGEAIVLARTSEHDVIHVATLHGNTGVGEVAFLDDRPRNADILITKSALVASITYNEFSSMVQGELHERFREFVLAGQSFGQSKIFSGIPDQDKQHWIKQGVPVRYKPGEVIIKANSVERWMALIVRGEVEVIRNGEIICILKTGNVFGEIAFLDNRPRTATLSALQDVLLWRWEPEWLSSEVDRIKLRPSLEALSRKRLGE